MSKLFSAAELASLRQQFFDSLEGEGLRELAGLVAVAADEAALAAGAAQGSADGAQGTAASAQAAADAAQADADDAHAQATAAMFVASAAVRSDDAARPLNWTGASSVRVPAPLAGADAATKAYSDDADSVVALAAAAYADAKFPLAALTGDVVLPSTVVGNVVTLVVENGFILSYTDVPAVP